jgi:arylsulfatase
MKMSSLSSSRPPNILWICTDQQRFDTLGCYDNPFVETPNIDRLAANGVLFENSFCQSPVCTPSRASFLTGRYPRTTRCRQNGQTIPADEKFVPRLLKDGAGYVNGLAGKLHTSFCNPDALFGTEHRIDDGYDEFHWSHHPDPDWATNEYIHWLQERGVTYSRTPYRGSEHVQAGMPAEYHQTTWCMEKAINFIRTNAEFDAPWLFSINTFDPHHHFDPPVEYLERYAKRLDEIPLPNYVPGEIDSKPIYQQIDHQQAYNTPGLHSFTQMTDDDHRLVRAAYWAMVDLIDAQVGILLDALEETEQTQNTIVIFTSDHGEMLGDHGIYLKGPHFYEPAVHVPLIISMPGTIPGGVRSRALVELVDIAPTLLDAAGIEKSPAMQGHSLWPLLIGATDIQHHRDDVYCEYYNAMPWHKNPPAYATMLRTANYKLVMYHGLNSGELYDLQADPNETHNQWSNTDYASIKMELLQRLCDRMAWTVDPLPQRSTLW